MTPRHDITADHAIGILNRHLDGDRWTFRRVDSQCVEWTTDRNVLIWTCEISNESHYIGISNSSASVSFLLTESGVDDLGSVAAMIGATDDNLRHALDAMKIACRSMFDRRVERMIARSPR